MYATSKKNCLSRCLRAGLSAAVLVLLSGCGNDTPRFEYIHMEGVELGYNMPYTPAIKVNSGKLVFISGVTAAPVYHSHPHVPAEFDHLDFSPGAQAAQAMENMRMAVEAAGGQLTDIAPSPRPGAAITVRRARRWRSRGSQPARVLSWSYPVSRSCRTEESRPGGRSHEDQSLRCGNDGLVAILQRRFAASRVPTPNKRPCRRPRS